MKPAYRGYTIIEVLLVLAISTTMLFSVLIIFRNQQSNSRYLQATQDLSSKIINISTAVAAGVAPDSERYGCERDARSLPLLNNTAGSSLTGGRTDCVFLGRAVQVVPGSGDIYVYTILGTKVPYAQYTTPQPKTIVDQHHPRLAQLANSMMAMNDTYKLPGGAKIKSASISNGGTDKIMNLAAFYEAIGGIAPSSGAPVLQLWVYPADSSVPLNNQMAPSLADAGKCPQNGCTGNPARCIEDSCLGTVVVDAWKLCVVDGQGQKPFLLTVLSSPSGISTKLIDNGC